MLDPEVAAYYADKIETKSFTLGTRDIKLLRAATNLMYNDRTEIEPIGRWADRLLSAAELREACGAASGSAAPQDPQAAKFAAPILAGEVPDLPVRIYWPEAVLRRQEEQKDAAVPLLLYFHGGGFSIHNIASHDALVRRLANTWSCVAISCGYRLAPEDPYPAAVQDSWALFCWAQAHAAELGADPGRILLSGDSAGATLSASVSRLAAETGQAEAIAAQILFYGDFGALPREKSDSFQSFTDGSCVLPREMAEYFQALYVPEEADPCDPFLHPGTGRIPQGLPRTIVVTAEYDPLRDDGETFAARLQEAGTDVTLLRAPGMMHGFLLLWNRFTKARQMIDEIGEML